MRETISGELRDLTVKDASIELGRQGQEAQRFAFGRGEPLEPPSSDGEHPLGVAQLLGVSFAAGVGPAQQALWHEPGAPGAEAPDGPEHLGLDLCSGQQGAQE